MPDADRIHQTVENIRKTRKGGLLSEIRQIKERHKTLEALTQTKQRAMTSTDKPKPHIQVRITVTLLLLMIVWS